MHTPPAPSSSLAFLTPRHTLSKKSSSVQSGPSPGKLRTAEQQARQGHPSHATCTFPARFRPPHSSHHSSHCSRSMSRELEATAVLTAPHQCLFSAHHSSATMNATLPEATPGGTRSARSCTESRTRKTHLNTNTNKQMASRWQ